MRQTLFKDSHPLGPAKGRAGVVRACQESFMAVNFYYQGDTVRSYLIDKVAVLQIRKLVTGYLPEEGVSFLAVFFAPQETVPASHRVEFSGRSYTTWGIVQVSEHHSVASVLSKVEDGVEFWKIVYGDGLELNYPPKGGRLSQRPEDGHIVFYTVDPWSPPAEPQGSMIQEMGESREALDPASGKAETGQYAGPHTRLSTLNWRVIGQYAPAYNVASFRCIARLSQLRNLQREGVDAKVLCHGVLAASEVLRLCFADHSTNEPIPCAQLVGNVSRAIMLVVKKSDAFNFILRQIDEDYAVLCIAHNEGDELTSLGEVTFGSHSFALESVYSSGTEGQAEFYLCPPTASETAPQAAAFSGGQLDVEPRHDSWLPDSLIMANTKRVAFYSRRTPKAAHLATKGEEVHSPFYLESEGYRALFLESLKTILSNLGPLAKAGGPDNASVFASIAASSMCFHGNGLTSHVLLIDGWAREPNGRHPKLTIDHRRLGIRQEALEAMPKETVAIGVSFPPSTAIPAEPTITSRGIAYKRLLVVVLSASMSGGGHCTSSTSKDHPELLLRAKDAGPDGLPDTLKGALQEVPFDRIAIYIRCDEQGNGGHEG